MKKGSIVVALVVLVLGTGALGAGASATAPGKKRCHFVKKEVHGKIKRVRVCTKPKPKPKPKATNVALTLDRADAATATVGAAGGKIETRTPSGASVTLTVPAGALAEDTAITLTPVSRMRGLPSKVKFVSGVQFGPDGLALAAPATLTISGKAGANGLAWFGNGQDAHRYPQQRTSSGVQLIVTHFSGVGTADGQASWLPDARMALTAFFARYVRPLLRRAETDDTAIDEAFSKAFEWERQAALLGILDDYPTFRREIRSSLEKALSNALRLADARCKNHDLTQIARMLHIDRIAQLLAVDLPNPSPVERIARCARFELDMSVEATTEKITDINSGAVSTHTVERTALQVKADHVLLSAGTNLNLEGEGALTLLKWEYQEDVTVNAAGRTTSCSVTGAPGHPSDTVRAQLKLGTTSGGQVQLTMRLYPGDVFTPVNSGCNLPARDFPFYLQGYWDHLYASQKTPDGRYVITFPAGGLHYGPDTRHLELQDQYGPVTFAGTLDLVLRHVPEA